MKLMTSGTLGSTRIIRWVSKHAHQIGTLRNQTVIVACVHLVLNPANLAPRSRRYTYGINNSAFEINPSRRDARTASPRGWMGAFSERGDHVIPV